MQKLGRKKSRRTFILQSPIDNYWLRFKKPQEQLVQFDNCKFIANNTLAHISKQASFMLKNFPEWKIRNYRNQGWSTIFSQMRQTKIQSILFADCTNRTIIREISHVKFINLTNLNLRRNNIVSIELLIGMHMPKLQHLQLHHNHISNISCLAKVDLRQLRTLTLYGNKLLELKNFHSVNFEMIKKIQFDSSVSYHEMVVEDLKWAAKVKCAMKSSKGVLSNLYSQKRIAQSQVAQMVSNKYKIYL